MTKNELIYLLMLQKASRIGDITAKKLIQKCGSPKAVFEEKISTLQKINGIGQLITKDLHHPSLYNKAEKELAFIMQNDIGYWYYNDDTYPINLKHCIDGPILLFHNGNIQLTNQKIISIVGTRNITNNGKFICKELIEGLKSYNPIIVSGYAYGTDITAHKEAIKHGLQTIGCLAHGLNQVYPKIHSKYTASVKANGGFITDFWSSSNPERENFLKRNRLIAGISQATIVIESAEKGGSLVTADIANSYNRDVFTIPGRVNDPMSLGCNNLIKEQKAHLITSAEDIIQLLNWESNTITKTTIQPELFIELNETEEKIIHYLKTHHKEHIDHIAISCQLPTSQLSSTLFSLELKGLIRPHPGKYFELIR